jgi:hypothetical protein
MYLAEDRDQCWVLANKVLNLQVPKNMSSSTELVKISLSCYGKNRLRQFEKRVLNKLFEHKRKEVTGGWK